MELARKQVWYRSVALGSRRRELLSWMLHTIFLSLNVGPADYNINSSSSNFRIFVSIGSVCFGRIIYICAGDLREHSAHSIGHNYGL